MKAEEKTVAFMFFSVVMQFVYSLGEQNRNKKKQKKKNRIWGWGGTKAEEQEGQILIEVNDILRIISCNFSNSELKVEYGLYFSKTLISNTQ